MNNKTIDPESSTSSEIDLENFRASVAFPLEKLQEIVYNDQKYSSTIISFIKQGLKKVRRQELEYGLVFFTQGEKILEYGASCGRIIDRNLIVCVLHNEAFCYQKINELPKSSKYLEALIFNLKAYIKSLQSTPTNSNLCEQAALVKAMPQLNRVPPKKNIDLSHYLLQFCSLSSQQKARKIALESAKNAVEIYKRFFTSYKGEKKWENLSFGSSVDREKVKTALSNFKPFREDFQTSKIQEYIKITRHYVCQWRSRLNKTHKTIVDKAIGGYSIGNFVELQPIDYEELDDKNNGDLEDPEEIVKQLIHYSMAYFQISTQYRLTVQDRYKIDPVSKQNCQQFKQSNIYHLYSILFVAMYIPYDLLFMEQIMTSYEHHFKVVIQQPLPQNNHINLNFVFEEQVLKQRVFSRKSKTPSDLKLIGKKKKSPLPGYHSKEPSKINQNIEDIAPSTAKQQYFSQGTNQNFGLRTKRNNSTQSKKSEKSEKKKIEKEPSQQRTTFTGYTRQRMRTKIECDTEEKIVKRKERAQDEYCAVPRSTCKQRKSSVEKFGCRKDKRSRKNSQHSSAGKSTTGFRKSSQERSGKKILAYHQSRQEKESKKIAQNKSPKKVKPPKEKKKKAVAIANYYL